MLLIASTTGLRAVGLRGSLAVIIPQGGAPTFTSQRVIVPLASVQKRNVTKVIPLVACVITTDPSVKEKDFGKKKQPVRLDSGQFKLGGSGWVKVNETRMPQSRGHATLLRRC